MSVDKKTVEKLAHLARLELNEDQKTTFGKDLGDILDWVEQLEEVDTEDVAPLGNVNEEEVPLREDKVVQVFKKDREALENAPEKDGDYFIVPKVLG